MADFEIVDGVTICTKEHCTCFRTCMCCKRPVGEHRVYFGVVGPFCDIACREKYLAAERAS